MITNRFGWITALVIAASGLAGKATWAQVRDNYGAIASSPDGKIWGYSYDYPTQEQAERKAMEECQRSSSDCKIQVWFKNACGALARDPQGKLGWAWAATQEQAETQAISACGERNCQVETWICTTRY
ncbi:MAG: DUF4189 domain-containing protein [Microcoleaceae cyanobacterium]